MQKLSKIHLSLISALALVGCDNVGGGSENSQVRQNKLTISNTPVFPHSGSGDVYALVLSNHTKEDMQLTNSQLKGISPSDEDSADDISSKLQLAKSLKAIQLTDLIDLSACQTIKAGANCIVTIELPKQVASGYFDFSLQYTDSNAKAYTVDKLVIFNAGMVANDGVILTNQYIESVVVNSDKYTLAIPFQLTDDFESIAIRQHQVAPTGYNQIICNNQGIDSKTNNSSKYVRNNSCTVLIELDSHQANPELALATTKLNGLTRFIEVKSSVLYGNYPELVIIGTPAILTNASSKAITIKNIGTQIAKDLQLTETGDIASFTVTKTHCAGKSLENNQQCFIKYQAKGNKQTATITQSVSYKGDDGLDTRMFSAKYPVYINKVANLKRPDNKNTVVEPPRITNNGAIEYFPEEIESVKVKFDQPINASSLFANGGALGYKENGAFRPCESILFLTESQVSCKFKSSDLQQMIGLSRFEIIKANIKNSAGSLQNAPLELWYEYTVRHHRNPRVSAITNTSQTFKPGDTIKLDINLDSSRYSANNRYRFNAQSGYTITSNTCQTGTNGCRIEVEYKIPDASQLSGSGTIQHTLPQHILSIVPASGSKPNELLILNSLIVGVEVGSPSVTGPFDPGFIWSFELKADPRFHLTVIAQACTTSSCVVISTEKTERSKWRISNGMDTGPNPRYVFLNSQGNNGFGPEECTFNWTWIAQHINLHNIPSIWRGAPVRCSIPGKVITDSKLKIYPTALTWRADGGFNMNLNGKYLAAERMPTSTADMPHIKVLSISPDSPQAIWQFTKATW